MKDQSRIQIRTRRVARTSPETKNNLKKVEAPVAAFKPYETIKPQKPEVKAERRTTRSATKDLKQSTLPFTTEEANTKRKSTTTRIVNKKQKKNHSKEPPSEDSKVENKSSNNKEEEREVLETTKVNIEESYEATIKAACVKEVTNEAASEEEITNKVASVEEITNEAALAEEITSEPASVDEITNETTPVEEEVTVKDSTVVEEKEIEVQTNKFFEEEETEIVNTVEDTPSPPSSNFPEPVTPPVSQSCSSAPYKTYLTDADKQRIEYEKTTLERLRKALDIVIIDRSARNRPCLYYQIESVLRNSTRRNVSLSHICQIMYITPDLYTMEPKEIRNYGGKATEDYLLGFGRVWGTPSSGKDFEKRATLLQDALNQYFIDHPQFDAVIPQIPLPKLTNVIDKQEWLKKAELPAGVRALLEAHEKVQKAVEDKQKPKPKPTGSVKDRMAALRARLAEKKK